MESEEPRSNRKEAMDAFDVCICYFEQQPKTSSV